MTFAHDAGLFPHQIDIAADRVLLVSLSEQDYLAVTAYLLQANGFPAGEALPGDTARLKEIGFAP